MISPNTTGARRRFKLWLLAMTVILAWAGYTLFSQMQRQTETEGRLTVAKDRLEQMQKQGEELQAKVKQLNDPEYISQLATKQQGLVKPGEELITPSE
ncbi:FtsB family cell division protein [Paenibacillus herberti]|uniref:Septum formation initiator n=1 Tax=Paenibacillus herberti TaxID=1619309 RepID=A0A229NXQ1_9BACL|nr:septum formation initiator family protein [Paenibacillus herberti]OXM14571.1 septum formation initiator [Paenibacillus herberti]